MIAQKPKFIYFDLDDTLLDHKSAERNALEDIREYFSFLADVDLGTLVDIYHRINSKQWKLYSEGSIDRKKLQQNRFELTLRELDADPGRHAEVGNKYMRCYRNHWRWVEGARSAFDQIRQTFEVGILTNGFSETQKAKFHRFNLYESAHHLVISEDVGHLKPHPKIFEHATSLTSYKPNEILYIGDSFNSDVKGGTGFGWNVAWFAANGEEEKNQQADFIFNDFTNLTDYLVI